MLVPTLLQQLRFQIDPIDIREFLGSLKIFDKLQSALCIPRLQYKA